MGSTQRLPKRKLARRGSSQTSWSRSHSCTARASRQESVAGGKSSAQLELGPRHAPQQKQGRGCPGPQGRRRRLARSHGRHPVGASDSEERLHGKVFKLATELGISTIRCLGFDSKDDFIQKKLHVLKSDPKEFPRWGTTVPKLLLLTETIISLFSLTNHMSGSVRICDKVARGAKHRVDDSSGRIAAYRPTTGSKPISLRHPVAFE